MRFRGIEFSDAAGPTTEAAIELFGCKASVVLPPSYREFLRMVGGGRFDSAYILRLSAAGRSADEVNRDKLESVNRNLASIETLRESAADWRRQYYRNWQSALAVAVQTDQLECLFPLQASRLSVAGLLRGAQDSYLVRELRCIPIGTTYIGDLWMGTVNGPLSGVFTFTWNSDWADLDPDDIRLRVEHSMLAASFDDFLDRIGPEPYFVPDESAAVNHGFLRGMFGRFGA